MESFKEFVTIDRYVKKTVEALQNAYNSKSMAAVDAVFREADETLARDKISEAAQQKFWASVHTATQSPVGWLFERQANSALIALMQAIQQRIAERQKQ